MRRTIGVTTAEHVVAGVVEDRKLVGPAARLSRQTSPPEALVGMPSDVIAQTICQQIQAAAQGQKIDAIGVGFPGIIRNGVIEDSPNLQQLKGCHMQETLDDGACATLGIDAPVSLYNDADIVAAGLAATRGHLDRLIRVWTLSNGIGFGRYPLAEGVWEGGHMVVSLDPNEKYCGCGGAGTWKASWATAPCGCASWIWSRTRSSRTPNRAISAASTSCELWHRALAAATASYHPHDGPGQVLHLRPQCAASGSDAAEPVSARDGEDESAAGLCVRDRAGGDEIAVIGAAVNAELAAFPE